MLHLIQRGSRDSQHSGHKPLRRTVLGGLILGLVSGLLPCGFPNLAPRLNAQAFPNRLRRGPNYPATAPNPTPPPSPAPAAAPPPSSAPAPASTQAQGQPAGQPFLPPSLLDQPAEPAKIEFSSNTLSIHADNSSLGAILHDISSKSGMQLQGFGADERVFGTFGPGKPREVLADLLNGTPYNLMMVGDLTNGAPRQLILTPTTPGEATPPSPQPTTTADNDSDDEDNVPPPRPPEPGQRREIVPGMNPQTVRTPQQMLQELEQMRQRQQQGQAAQPQQ
jgi:hypothetical protein